MSLVRQKMVLSVGAWKKICWGKRQPMPLRGIPALEAGSKRRSAAGVTKCAGTRRWLRGWLAQGDFWKPIQRPNGARSPLFVPTRWLRPMTCILGWERNLAALYVSWGGLGDSQSRKLLPIGATEGQSGAILEHYRVLTVE